MGEPPKTCFIAMPITTHPTEAERYGDRTHWRHVMDHLFVPAIKAADFEPVIPISRGSSMIHAEIVKNLEQCDLVLCDFSGENPNVFFELGVRTSLDKPMALVRDDTTRIPFDLGGVNVHEYQSGLHHWDMPASIKALADHLRDAETSCAGANPLWRQFGLTLRAQESDPNESPTDAALALLREEVAELRTQVDLSSGSARAAAINAWVSPNRDNRAGRRNEALAVVSLLLETAPAGVRIWLPRNSDGSLIRATGYGLTEPPVRGAMRHFAREHGLTLIWEDSPKVLAQTAEEDHDAHKA